MNDFKSILQQGVDKGGEISDDLKKTLGKIDKASENVDSMVSTIRNGLDWVGEHKTPVLAATGVAATGMTAANLYNKMHEARKNQLEAEYYHQQLEKNAGIKDFGEGAKEMFQNAKPLMKKQLIGGAGLAAGAAGLQGTNMLINKIKEKVNNKGEKYWEQFVSKYPEYDSPEAKEHYQVMLDVSPAMAKHPIMIKSFLDSSYGMDAISPDTVNLLGRIQSEYGKRDNGGTRQFLETAQGMADSVGQSMDPRNQLQAQYLQQQITGQKLRNSRDNMEYKIRQDDLVRDAQYTKEQIDKMKQSKPHGYGNLSPESKNEYFMNGVNNAMEDINVMNQAVSEGMFDDLVGRDQANNYFEQLQRKRLEEMQNKMQNP